MIVAISIMLLLVVVLPLVFAAIVPLCGRASRRVALLFAILHLGLTAAVVGFALPVLNTRTDAVYTQRQFEPSRFEPLFVPGSGEGTSTRTTWTLLSLSAKPTRADRGGPNIQFYIGLDGINVWLMALASFMLLPAILVSWDSIQERRGAFYGWLFLLQGGTIGAFLSFDVILFYVFFELTLIPSFFLIGGWGVGSGRRDAARKFFLYTLAGSLLTLVGMIGIVLTNPNEEGTITFSLPDLMANVQHMLSAAFEESQAGKPEKLNALHDTQYWLFIALVAGFMVKTPVWPFHTWLPSAYGEAPIGVTILLSSLLAKLGTFGIIRFVLTLTPDAALVYGLPVIGGLAAFGIVYAALCAYAQRDIKLMIAYSSVSHLGFLVLGILAFNTEGLSGAVLHMVNHGLSTGGLFALLAFLLDRYGTTQMSQYGGLMGRFPAYGVLVFVICLASIGLPGLNNFVSEMLMLAGIVDARNPGVHRLWLAFFATFSILLGAWYILTMLQRVFFNPHKEPPAATLTPPTDIKQRELVAFGSIAVLCLLLGLFPQPVLDSMRRDVRAISNIGVGARERVTGIREPVELPPAPPAPVEPKAGGKGEGKGGKKGGGKGKGGGDKGMPGKGMED
jgi:NADH-quinone oxidoreductase subunit M